VESDLELTCSWVIHTGKPSTAALASSEWGILHLAQVGPFGQQIGYGTMLACYSFLLSFLISAHLCFLQGSPERGMDALVSQAGSTQVQEKNIVVLASVRGDAGDLVRKMALFKGELAEARWAPEVAEDRFRHLMNSSSEGVQELGASKVGRHAQFEELSLL
jgi:hypothetical protein